MVQMVTAISSTNSSPTDTSIQPKTQSHSSQLSSSPIVLHEAWYVSSWHTTLLGWKSGVGGVSDSGFSSCTVPTYYCGSKYFYSQCPQVQNLIRTKCSLNRSEHRVKNKAS